MDIVKIVGKPDKTTWSQVHSFLPQDEKLKSHGELMAVLAFKAKDEAVEVSSFGTEIINRLQEIYYSNESESILKKIEQSLESLAAEFLTKVELEAVMVVVWKTYLYAGRNGKGQVVLKRGETKVHLLQGVGIETVSGELKPGDRWLLGTEQLFRIVIEGEIGPILANQELEQAGESLGALVYGHEHNSQVAAVVAETNKVERESVREDEKRTNKIKEAMKKSKRWVVNKWRQRPEIHLGKGGRGKKSALSAALILILVFGVSLGLAGSKKQRQKQQQQARGVIEEAQYKYNEAHNLLKLNPLRAKSLLTSAKVRIEEYQQSHGGELSGELKEWLGKIETDLGGVQREYKVESGTEWFDFNLVKDGFKGSDWEIEDDKVWVWDATIKTVVEVNLETKASRIVIGGEKIKEGGLVGFTGERGFIIGGTEIAVVDAKDGKVVAEVSGEDWKNISDSVGFGSNLYLLDKSKTGQIWKYLGVTSGLSSKRSYLKGETYDLSEAMSMAIDGSVWVLFSDGTIVKYVQGVKDAFVVAGLDKNFEEPIKIFTSPEEKNLYVLDRRQTRVVVISKTGEYQAQYEWPGMAGVKDLVVSEKLKKMFLLTGEKVFTIDIQ
ncbi:MAG: hypothetical protein U0946_00690 [Patescibacteria group bacterium]|nr:hypothetical protein [Patescibacteria group bacterium]